MPTKRLKKIPYTTVDELLKYELPKDEGEHLGTSKLIKRLSHIRKTKMVTRSEFLSMCHWKSPRAVRHYSKNHTATIQKALHTSLSTRSEREKFACRGLDRGGKWAKKGSRHIGRRAVSLEKSGCSGRPTSHDQDQLPKYNSPIVGLGFSHTDGLHCRCMGLRYRT